MNGKLLRQVLDKMLKSPVAQEARVQVCLVQTETWNMGKVIKKIGE